MFSLLNTPATALAIGTRVSKFEDDYIKNNDGKKPDQGWYDEAFLSQAALLLGERLGVKKLGEMALNKASKKIATPLAIAGGGAFEYAQEGGEYVSEQYLTQKEGEKNLLDIATSPDAQFNAFVGLAAGTALTGAAKTTEAIKATINPTDEQKKDKIAEELNKSIENTDLSQEDILNKVHPNQAYYQQQNQESQNINNSPTPTETPIINKQLENVTQGFEKLQEEIKANNKKPIEELLQKDLEVKVADEPTTNQILDNNITTNQEVQNQDTTLPVSTVEENIIPQNDENNIFKPFEFIRKDGNKSIKVSEIGNSEATKAIYDNYSGEELDLDFNGYKTKGKILPNSSEFSFLNLPNYPTFLKNTFQLNLGII
jgi:hypothetical protein